MSSKTELETGVKALFDLSESELEKELGRRLAQTAGELDEDQDLTATHAGGITVDREKLQALPDFARKLAERFLSRFEREMYSLICDKDDPDNDKIRSAAVQGAEVLAYVISGALVATFGWLPGIATVIAVIIAKRLAKSGYGAFCETWEERLKP